MACLAVLRVCRRMIQKPATVRDQSEVIAAANQNPHEGTFSRFLSKELKGKNSGLVPASRDLHDTNPISTLTPEKEYEWHYMAFCTLWRATVITPIENSGQVRTDESTDETHVLLCFDLDDDTTLRLRRILHKADQKHWKNEPFLMLEYALRIVIDQCERDLWSFHEPVRHIEKVKVFPRFIQVMCI